MRKTKALDPKMAPKNWGSEASRGLTDTHHPAVTALLSERMKVRDKAFARDALAFLEDWRERQPGGYYAESPERLVIAAILATAIRRSMARG